MLCGCKIDLVTVFDAILTSRQTREKLQCLYENLMSNNLRKTAVLKKISGANCFWDRKSRDGSSKGMVWGGGGGMRSFLPH